MVLDDRQLWRSERVGIKSLLVNIACSLAAAPSRDAPAIASSQLASSAMHAGSRERFVLLAPGGCRQRKTRAAALRVALRPVLPVCGGSHRRCGASRYLERSHWVEFVVFLHSVSLVSFLRLYQSDAALV